jgi:hypothetical protein
MTADKAVVDGLNSPEYARLLGVVDSFRALGISKEISLPQVSFLQSLTRMPAHPLVGGGGGPVEW